MKTLLILIISILLMISLTLFFYYKPNPPSKNTAIVSFDNVEINAEVADTQTEISRGLMYREELGDEEGMLFIFDDEKDRSFWMKNTLLPLDMVFLDSEKKIVHIVNNARPCEENPCLTYSSEKPAKYVIEVNAGFTQEHNIKVGDEVSFS